MPSMSSAGFSIFLKSHLAEVEPLSRAINLAYWNATISGNKNDFDHFANLQVKLQKVYSDKASFQKIHRWRDGGSLSDPLDRRQVELLYSAYLRNQIDPSLNEEITKLASKIENQFNVFRAKLNGRTVTSNDILTILKESNDSQLRKSAWEAGKQVGAIVREDLVTLVKLRNEAAQSLGFKNYYAMSLRLNEQDEDEIVALFNQLDALTHDPFRTLKLELDERLARRYGIEPWEVLPWHYEDPFFQEAPQVFSVNLDRYFSGHDIVELVTRFYAGIGLQVDDIIARSDLYEKPGKEQHAYCTDIDRKGDIRVLANINNDETWMGTMLHELGHAVYDKYIDKGLPFLLRQEAHIFTTEAIAMMFGRLSKDADWIQLMTGISNAEKQEIAEGVTKSQRLAQLIFARWTQVMMNFERELYAAPDQNINELWWRLAEKYQMLTPPEGRDFPDWASKIHVVSAPVYYHNYLLGEIFASQLRRHIENDVIPSSPSGLPFTCNPAVGECLRERVFGVGARYRWDDLVERATGEKLTPKYFVDQFIN